MLVPGLRVLHGRMQHAVLRDVLEVIVLDVEMLLVRQLHECEPGADILRVPAESGIKLPGKREILPPE